MWPAPETAAASRMIAAAVRGDRDAHAALIEHALSSVLAEAVAHRDRGVELLDLFQEGSLAALVAVEEYVERTGNGQVGEDVFPHGAAPPASEREDLVCELPPVLEEEEAEDGNQHQKDGVAQRGDHAPAEPLNDGQGVGAKTLYVLVDLRQRVALHGLEPDRVGRRQLLP